MTATTPTTYRWTALGSALLRMWRGWSVIVPVVIVNAALQALLVWPDVTPAWDLTTIALALASAVVFGLALAFVTATALRVPDGRVTWPAAWTVVRARWLAFAAWSAGLLVALVVAAAVNPLVCVLVVVLTPFVLLAALDERGNALVTDLRTIGRRFWRWLLTAAIVGVVLVIGSALAGVTQFFLRGGFGAAVVWIVAGLVLAWFTVAWGLIYRSAWSQNLSETDSTADPDLEQAA